MTGTANQLCPVCGTGAGDVLRPGSCTCPVCGYAFAYVQRFAGETSLAWWKQDCGAKKAEFLGRMQKLCRNEELFALGGGAIVCRSPQKGTLSLVRGSGVQAQAENVRQYSAPENPDRNEVRLLADGTVQATGDNEYRQCDTGRMKNIRRILATSSCTYGITGDGEVIVCGQPASPAVGGWKHVRALASGAYHVAGLTSDGRVLVAGELLNRAISEEIGSWREITQIAAAGDATIGLRKDGTVLFAGKANDPRNEVKRWKKVVDIAIESVYAVGLTAEGQVLLAGENKNSYLDMGRKDAANWRDIVAISCSRSGIGALGMDGSVHLAGNIRDINRLRDTWSALQEEFHRELVTAAVHGTI